MRKLRVSNSLGERTSVALQLTLAAFEDGWSAIRKESSRALSA
jgi:hypothetical protein